MRTTINLGDKTYEIVRSIAQQNRQGLGTTIELLIQRALETNHDQGPSKEGRDAMTGFPLIASRRPVTEEDVRNLEEVLSLMHPDGAALV